MAIRRDVEDDIRRIHGDDVEIVEMEAVEGSYQPTGKRYAVVKPDPLAGWSGWLKVMFFILAFVVLGAGLLASLAVVVIALGFLWTLFGPH